MQMVKSQIILHTSTHSDEDIHSPLAESMITIITLRQTHRPEQTITKTRLFKYIENFTTKKMKTQMKNTGNFHISAQNIDCGYSTIDVFEQK